MQVVVLCPAFLSHTVWRILTFGTAVKYPCIFKWNTFNGQLGKIKCDSETTNILNISNANQEIAQCSEQILDRKKGSG